MNKKSRKAVHDLANKIGMRSKSKGNGAQRRATLYKTKSTLSPEASMAEIKNFLNRRFPQRTSVSERQCGHFDRTARKTNATRGQRAEALTIVAYRDGDFVGAAAPQISVNNKGRSMLEKMGWSTGTGLGARNNKGDLFPITQKVKSSRTGLM